MKLLGFALLAAALTLGSLAGRTSAAEKPPKPPTPEAADWYYRPAPEREAAPTIAQQKAMHRAEQRMMRQDALRWYGFSASRPTAAPLAITSMSSPQWQMPGGRPYAWYMSSRPVVVYSRPYSVYR